MFTSSAASAVVMTGFCLGLFHYSIDCQIPLVSGCCYVVQWIVPKVLQQFSSLLPTAAVKFLSKSIRDNPLVLFIGDVMSEYTDVNTFN